MANFEDDLMNSVKCAMTKQINNADFINIPYDSKLKLPSDFIDAAWGLIDKDSLMNKLAKRLEDELVDRMVNHMAAEIATDIKQVLSVKERREAIRHLARSNIDILTSK